MVRYCTQRLEDANQLEKERNRDYALEAPLVFGIHPILPPIFSSSS